MTSPNIATNPETGVQYYADGPFTGDSVKRYVTVADGQILNPSGKLWPFNAGAVHDLPADLYEYVPFEPLPFDARIFVVDNERSGWHTVPFTPTPPAGHPKGKYERTEVIRRRSSDELRTLVYGYYQNANNNLWPQESGYDQKLAYAKEQVNNGNRRAEFRAEFTDLIARHEQLIAASFQNEARLKQLYAEITAAGETGAIDFNPEEGWINGI